MAFSASVSSSGTEQPSGTQQVFTTILIPLDYYKILQIAETATGSTIKKAYDRAQQAASDSGYSPEAIFSRSEVLLLIAERLGDPDFKLEYDEQLANEGTVPETPIDSADLAGALMLLQESQQFDAVIEIGSKWLDDNLEAEERADVAISVALALCDKAASLLDNPEGKVSDSCEMLESALELLQTNSASGALQQQLSQTLEELAPQYTLEQLALPLDDEHIGERAQALLTLRTLVWPHSTVEALSVNMREEFVRQARTHMTAVEQIGLYQNVPASMRVSVNEMLETALAYVAEGVERRSPKLIHKADQLFVKAEAALAAAATDTINSGAEDDGGAQDPIDVSVERAVCAVLLGETDRAAYMLGLAPNSRRAADPSVESFVRERCRSPRNLRPGLYALSEAWLSEACLPVFREKREFVVSLDQWASDPEVGLELQMLELRRNFGVGSMLKVIAYAISSALASLRNALMSFLSIFTGRKRGGRGGVQYNVNTARQVAASQRRRTPPLRAGTLTPRAAAAGDAGDAGSSASGLAAEADRRGAPAIVGEVSTLPAFGTLIRFNRGALEEETLTIADLRARVEERMEEAGVSAVSRSRSPTDPDQSQFGLNSYDENYADVDGGGYGRAPAAFTSNTATYRLKRGSTNLRTQGLEVQGWSALNTVQEDEDAGGNPVAAAIGGMLKLTLTAAFIGVAYMATRRLLEARITLPALPVPTLSMPSLPSLPSLPAIFKSRAPAASTSNASTDAIDAGTAERVVRNWMRIKASALGSRHSTELLADVLDGPMLDRWTDKADSAQVNKCHWAFTLRGIKVTKVTAASPRHFAEGASAADVVAHIDESASVYEGGVVRDSYKAPYVMRYHLEQLQPTAGAKGWRITEATNLGPVQARLAGNNR